MSARRGSARSLRTLPYRPCVGVMLLNRERRVFLGRRRSEAGPEHVSNGYAWQMPQGGIDPGEDTYRAALRELYEETSIRSVQKLAEIPEWLTYDIPASIAGHAWRGKYRGQTQKWYALRFVGNDSEINIVEPGGGGHKAEFAAWRWERLEKTPELVVPFKKPVYDRVVRAFKQFAQA